MVVLVRAAAVGMLAVFTVIGLGVGPAWGKEGDVSWGARPASNGNGTNRSNFSLTKATRSFSFRYNSLAFEALAPVLSIVQAASLNQCLRLALAAGRRPGALRVGG